MLKKILGVSLILLLLLTLVPAVAAQMTPSVTVSDQEVGAGFVTVDNVVSEGPGWIVIHADQDGAPGPVLGQTAVTDGENVGVTVEIDVDNTTNTLYAMLHTDAGEEGVYEFPGADTPVSVDGQVVVQPFTVTGGLMEAMDEEAMAETEMMAASVTVSSQSVENGSVTVDSVTSEGPGWIVIHADADGSPGPVLGHTAVTDGENQNVMVEIDPEAVTPVLYAMLHTDAGEEGVYEFPGDDTPVNVDGQVVVQSFEVTGGLPESAGEVEVMAEAEETPQELPATGGVTTPWLVVGLLLLGTLLAVSGLALARRSA